MLWNLVCFPSIVEFQKTGKEPVNCSFITKMTIQGFVLTVVKSHKEVYLKK